MPDQHHQRKLQIYSKRAVNYTKSSRRGCRSVETSYFFLQEPKKTQDELKILESGRRKRLLRSLITRINLELLLHILEHRTVLDIHHHPRRLRMRDTSELQMQDTLIVGEAP